ncbi:MAG TPA: glycosyltransferase [Candidatus Limnocylindrales bacterium]|nr:glycosyltransferase [Candidatus Limnocylindrales bacterium]
MRISLIVPAFNEERLLGDSLAAIQKAARAFTLRDWGTELIVCDNNSTDRTAEVARAAGAKVVFEPINQIGRARNRGAQAATCDWLIFVDADSQPTLELFAAVGDQIDTGCCLAGGSTVKLEGDFPKAKSITALWNCLSRRFKLLAGSFIFCQAKAFHTAGGFSEKLFAGEELDLTVRLKRIAREQRKKVVILHGHPLLTSARKLHLYSGRDHLWFIAKVMLAPQKVLTSRDACFTWYDGRR